MSLEGDFQVGLVARPGFWQQTDAAPEPASNYYSLEPLNAAPEFAVALYLLPTTVSILSRQCLGRNLEAAWDNSPVKGRGQTAGLFEYQGRWPSLATGRRSSFDGMRGSRFSVCAVSGSLQPWASNRIACQRFSSRGVGTRTVRWRRSLAPICHCSKKRSIYLTAITNPSLPPKSSYLRSSTILRYRSVHPTSVLDKEER